MKKGYAEKNLAMWRTKKKTLSIKKTNNAIADGLCIWRDFLKE